MAKTARRGSSKKRGLSEKTYYAFNPLPDMTDREILDSIGMEDVRGAEKFSCFEMNWQWSTGLERERLRIKPGHKALLRETEAKQWMKEFREQGGVLLEVEAKPAEIRKATVDGLERAARFYRERGEIRVIEFAKTQGLGTGELDRYKYSLWVYYLNEAKANILFEEAKKLRNKRTPGRPRKTDSEEVAVNA